MKINLDCVRDVMLCVEANTGLHQRCYFIDYALNSAQEFVGDLSPTPDYQAELEKKYHNEELLYHLKYCIESGLLSVDGPVGLYQTWVCDLTPKGHDFLANIRSKTAGIKSSLLFPRPAPTALTWLLKSQKPLQWKQQKTLCCQADNFPPSLPFHQCPCALKGRRALSFSFGIGNNAPRNRTA